ncbi:MAG: PilZ domain-containing protein [Deltaproteobacteria bacterium]|nr:PilZ domain-containing protein [Deltaproteobacteria bacterium]
MASKKKPDWILLEYSSQELLDHSILDRSERLLFYPSVGRMGAGQSLDIQICVEGSNVLFPMKATVQVVRERPEPDKPRGVTLEIIPADAKRFERMCAFADGMWKPSARRAAPRYKAEIRASYTLDGKSHSGETADISTRGIFLRTDGPLAEPGSQFPVRLQPSRLRSSIELVAEVRWVDRVEGRQGMGLLLSGPPEQLSRLTELVHEVVKQQRPD